MPQHIETCKRLRQHRFDFHRVAISFGIDRISEIHFLAVYARSQGLLRQITVELFERFCDGGRTRNRDGSAILQLYIDLAHRLSTMRQFRLAPWERKYLQNGLKYLTGAPSGAKNDCAPQRSV